MAKKVFYTKKKSKPKWIQVYLVWAVLMLVFLPIVYWLGTYQKSDFAEITKNIPEQKLITKRAYSMAFNIDDDTPQTAVFERLNTDLKIPGITQIQSSYKYRGKPCNDVVWLRKAQTDRKVFFFLPYNTKKVGHYIYSTVSMLETLQNKEISREVIVIFYEKNSHCMGTRYYTSKIENYRLIDAALVLEQDPEKTGILSSSGLTGEYSSLAWDYLLPDLKKESFLNQWVSAAFTLFQNQAGPLINNKVPAIGFEPVATGIELRRQIREIFLKLIHVVENSETRILENESLIISETKGLKKWALWVMISLLIIFMWLPFVNKLGIEKKPLNAISAGLMAIFYSLPVLVGFLFIYILTQLNYEHLWVTVTGFAVILLLYMIFQRIQNKALLLKVNNTSSALIANLLMSIVAFLNPMLFILLIPANMLYIKVKTAGIFIKYLYLILGLLPLAFVLYNGTDLTMVNSYLAPQFITGNLISDWGSSFFMAIVTGSFLSLIKKETNLRDNL